MSQASVSSADEGSGTGGASGDVWPMPWLTPLWCRAGLLGLIALAVIPRLLYLHSPQAVDLAPDEAQYWVWSRHLDWSYYSKGPMVAWIIRLSTEVFGSTMPGIRYAALAIGVGMTLLTYGLTKLMFGSERVALGAVVLTFVVPMFIAGSMLMTIDPPFVLFWSLATACFVVAGFRGRAWAWPVGGLLVGMSFLAKYSALLLLPGLLLALVADRRLRRYLWHWGPWVATAVAGVCTLPVLYWNARNDWVSFAHVRGDIAAGFSWMSPVEFFGGQVAVVGPLLALMAGGVLLAFRGGAGRGGGGGVGAMREADAGAPVAGGDALLDGAAAGPVRAGSEGTDEAGDGRPAGAAGVSGPGELAGASEPWGVREARFLVLTVAPFLASVSVTAFFTNAQLNWTAPVWFALVIVAAWFVATRLSAAALWRPWRGVVYATLAYGLVLMPVTHNMPALYPAFAWVQTRVLGYEVPVVRRWDPTARLRGWEELAREVEARRIASVGPEAFVLAENYSVASVLEFYLPGNPRTHVMGPFIEDPARRGQITQWDMWPERSLERGQTLLAGQNAIFVGRRWQVLEESFERVEPIGEVFRIHIESGGQKFEIAAYRIWGLFGFRGMPRPEDGHRVW